jgi:hypothetical protein
MTNEEAKFILSAYRPNGSDAGDAAFSDALLMAGEDPMLAAWFARSRSHDAAIAAKLGQISPPSGLREAILAGARVSDSRRADRRGWAWIAGVAAAAVLAFVVVSMKTPSRPDSAGAAFAGFAIEDMLNGKHGGKGEPTGALVAELETTGAKMPGAEQIDFDRLRETGCRTLSFSGHDVLEVCFLRDGSLFHLYMIRRDGSVSDSVARGPSFVTQATGAAVVWADQRFDYVVASTAGVDALRRLL